MSNDIPNWPKPLTIQPSDSIMLNAINPPPPMPNHNPPHGTPVTSNTLLQQIQNAFVLPLPIFEARIPVEGMNEIYCCYSHTIGDEIMFIGVCRTHEIFFAPDARKNSEWKKVFANQQILELKMHMIGSSLDCQRFRETWMRTFKRRPRCNLFGHMTERFSKIQCVETGEIFESQVAVCLAVGVATSQMSNHIRGVPGHRTIKGRRYIKI